MRSNFLLFISALCLLLQSKTAMAQQPVVQSQPAIEISGIVKDANGKPLSGVSIIIKGSIAGTTTNNEGAFKLQLVKGSTIKLSYVGFVAQEIKVSDITNYTVVLVDDSKSLEEVVVTGYQTISKERATGSFSVIGENMLSKRPVTTINQAFSGLTTGLEEKANGQLLIRGRGTLQNEFEPLIVVDGFPIEGSFKTIIPGDVKSINILKDAAATSIWGARAANGVIVITTKNAKSNNKVNVSISSFLKISENIDLDYALDIANSKTHIAFEELYFKHFKPSFQAYELVNNSTGRKRFTMSESMMNIWELDRGVITQAEYDNRKANLLSQDYKDQYYEHLLQKQVNYQQNIVISGSGEKNTYRISMLYEKDLTSFKGNENNKYIVNFMNSIKLLPSLTYTGSLNFHSQDILWNGTDLNTIRRLTSPYSRLLDDKGDYASMSTVGGVYIPFIKDLEPLMPYKDWDYNMLQEVKERNRKTKSTDFRFQNRLDWKITNNLNLSGQFQYEKNSQRSEELYYENSFFVRNIVNTFSKRNATTGLYDAVLPKGAIIKDNSSEYSSLNFRAQLDYNKVLDEKNEIVAVAGGEAISTTRRTFPNRFRFGYNPRSLVAPTFNHIPSSSTYTYFDVNTGDFVDFYPYEAASSPYGYTTVYNDRLLEDRYVSAYANVAYTYNQKFTASLSLRTDASNFVSETIRSKFSPFWSVGGSWNIKKESFLSDLDFINRLILRGSYGVAGLAAGRTGNSTLTTVSSATPTAIMDNQPINNILTRGNPSLTWEKSTTSNLGFDFNLFKSKLYGSVDYYYKKSTDVLSAIPVSYVNQSTASLTTNNANIVNKGLEFSLKSNLNITKNLSWTGNLNLSFNSNKITRYDFVQTLLSSYTTGTFQKGKSVDDFYAFRVIGYSPEGYIIYQRKDKTSVTVNSNTSNPIFTNMSLTPGTRADDNENIYFQGQMTPKVLMGFASTLNYKNFSFMFVLSGKFGHMFKRGDVTDIRNINQLNYRSDLESGWQKGNPLQPYTGRPWPNDDNAAAFRNSFMYGWYQNFLIHSENMTEKGDFVRAEELYLGYDLPRSVFGKKMESSLNIFTQLKNGGILWAANKKGIDPDYRYTAKPLKTFTIGLKLNF